MGPRQPNLDLFEQNDEGNLLIHDSEQDLKNINELRAFTLNSIQSSQTKNLSDKRPFKTLNNEPMLDHSSNS